MGVGKTVQALGILYLYRKEWPLLIVCPSSLKYIWQDEILTWIPELKDYDIQIFKTGKDRFDRHARIFIMSYDLASRKSAELIKKNF